MIDDGGGTPPPAPLTIGLGWFPDDRNGLNRYLFDLTAARAARAAHAGRPAPPVIVSGPARDVPGHVRVAGTLADPLPLRLLKLLVAARGLADGADLVDGHFAAHTLVHLLSPRLRALPLLVHFQGPWADESAASGTSGAVGVGAKRAIERAVYRRADAVVTLSSAFRRLVVERYGVSPWRVQVIAPGVDVDRFRPGGGADDRQALDLPAGAFVAVTARRLVPRTGVDHLLDAWATLLGGRPSSADPALLVVVGTGPERPRLERLAGGLGIADSVRFLGAVDDDTLAAAYRAADVCVVPSADLEGFGLVVLESLACGTPVVGTDSGGLAEAARAAGHDAPVAAGDRAGLADLLDAAASGALELPSAEDCRAVAVEHSWTRVVEAHDRLHRTLVGPDGERSLRIVVLDHTAQPSGAELSMARWVAEVEGDVDAHVIFGAAGPIADRLTTAGRSVEVHRLPTSVGDVRRASLTTRTLPWRSVARTAVHVVRLARRLRHLRPDLVHTNSLKSALYGGCAARLAGIPVVWHLHDRIATDYLPRPAVRAIRLLAARLPAHVIVNSQATATTLGRRVRPTVVPEAVPRPETPAARRGDGPLRFGIVGRLSPWKGQDLFLEAFALAFPEGGATAAVTGDALFGEEDIGPSLRALAERLGIADRVEFDGHVDDVESRMRSMDVVVHASSLPEPFGMVVAEAMALALPVIAVDAAGPAEIITDGVDGVLVPLGDRDALAAAMRSLAADPERRLRLGRAARARSEEYTPARVAARIRAVHQAVAGR